MGNALITSSQRDPRPQREDAQPVRPTCPPYRSGAGAFLRPGNVLRGSKGHLGEDSPPAHGPRQAPIRQRLRYYRQPFHKLTDHRHSARRGRSGIEPACLDSRAQCLRRQFVLAAQHRQFCCIHHVAGRSFGPPSLKRRRALREPDRPLGRRLRRSVKRDRGWNSSALARVQPSVPVR